MTETHVFPQDTMVADLAHHVRMGGLELRDYFAAQSFQAFIMIAAGTNIDSALENAAMMAYKSADALLRERDKGKGADNAESKSV